MPRQGSESGSRLPFGKAQEEATQIRELVGPEGEPEDYQAAHELLLQEEVQRSLENKPWETVFSEAVLQTPDYLENQREKLTLQAKVAHLEEQIQSNHRYLDVYRQNRDNLKEAQAMAEIDSSKALVQKVRSDEFFLGTYRASDYLVESLPDNHTPDDEAEIRERVNALQGRLDAAYHKGEESVILSKPEAEIYKMALKHGAEIVEQRIREIRERLEEKKTTQQEKKGHLSKLEEQLKEGATRIETITKILDEKEQTEGAPEDPLERVNWRHTRKKEAEGQSIRWEQPVGDKWAFFWEEPDSQQLYLLNREKAFLSVYPSDIITYRQPGRVFALYSEGLLLRDRLNIQMVIEDSVPKLIYSREEKQKYDSVLKPAVQQMREQLE